MTTSSAPSSRLRRATKRIVRIFLIAYLGCCMVLYFAQTRLIFPGASTQGTPAAKVHPMPGEELARLESSHADTIYVLFGRALTPDGKPHPDASHRPTLIFFYGNGMSMVDCGGLSDDFRRLGTNVAVVEYPGYGMSSGKPTEIGIYAAADAAYDWLVKRPDIDPNQIIPTGLSIGGGAAIELATRRPIAAVATFAAFTSLPEMARKVMPWFPTSLLIKYHFDNESKLRKIAVPAFLAHGTADSLVPFAMNARLAAAARGPVTTFPIQAADHNDLFEVGGKPLMNALGHFIDDVHNNRTGKK